MLFTETGNLINHNLKFYIQIFHNIFFFIFRVVLSNIFILLNNFRKIIFQK